MHLLSKLKIICPWKVFGKANRLYSTVYSTSDQKRLCDPLTEENVASYSLCCGCFLLVCVETSWRMSLYFMCMYVHTWLTFPPLSAVQGDLLLHSPPMWWPSHWQAPVALNSTNQHYPHCFSVRKWQGWQRNRLTLSYTQACIHHYLLICITTCQIMCEGGISIITHSEANNHEVYLSPIGKSCFHFSLLPRPWTEFSRNKIARAIKKMLSSLNRVLLHSGQKDFC